MARHGKFSLRRPATGKEAHDLLQSYSYNNTIGDPLNQWDEEHLSKSERETRDWDILKAIPDIRHLTSDMVDDCRNVLLQDHDYMSKSRLSADDVDWLADNVRQTLDYYAELKHKFEPPKVGKVIEISRVKPVKGTETGKER